MTWDLSVLYESFQSPVFQKDLAEVKTQLGEIEKSISGSNEPKALLEKVIAQFKALMDTADKLSAFIYLTWSTDAENEEAANYLDQLMAVQVDF